jgi:hypothetical protein
MSNARRIHIASRRSAQRNRRAESLYCNTRGNPNDDIVDFSVQAPLTKNLTTHKEVKNELSTPQEEPGKSLSFAFTKIDRDVHSLDACEPSPCRV